MANTMPEKINQPSIIKFEKEYAVYKGNIEGLSKDLVDD